ncbi:hypothetical protein [Methylovirgula sp. HY1]|uniref:hypothetical protein n=1 Tax=Methylovirgula sp. HY1 TaxID=2822761 RepID=UPI001C5B4BC2|nr:hypothetical protein [Methylovirgula sp. HY1]
MTDVRQSPFAPNAVLPPERFVEAFVAKLVVSGWRSIAPRDPDTRRALASVVDLLDRCIEQFEGSNVEWSRVVPWVRTANSLRMSALGGVENWEHQFRAAQGFLTRVSNPSYEIVDFALTPATARQELDQLTADQAQLIEQAVKIFSDKQLHASE